MTREQLEAAILTSPHVKGRIKQMTRVNGIEDYLFIGGPNLTARESAERLGVSMRTIWRYNHTLRQVTS